MKTKNALKTTSLALMLGALPGITSAALVDGADGVDLGSSASGLISNSLPLTFPSQSGGAFSWQSPELAGFLVPVSNFTGVAPNGGSLASPDLIPLRTTNINVVNNAGNTIFSAGPGGITGIAAVTAGNGLTATDGNVRLGGALNQATTIAQGGNNLIFTQTTGNVGIGFSTPLAPLHVGGSRNVATSGVRLSLNALSLDVLDLLGIDITTNGSTAATIISEGPILTKGSLISLNGSITTSDARFKKVIGVSDQARDLELLNRIKITDYTYIDKLSSGRLTHKKVIAQQVEEVLPAAVQKRRDFAPDIFAPAGKVEAADNGWRITLNKAHALKAGDRVRLYDEKDKEIDAEVTAAEGNGFSIASAADLSKGAFVYGMEHSDIRAVDYEAISMLNVSATQALGKQLAGERERNDAQQAEINALKAENSELKTLAADLKQLKDLVAAMEGKSDRSVVVSVVK